MEFKPKNEAIRTTVESYFLNQNKPKCKCKGLIASSLAFLRWSPRRCPECKYQDLKKSPSSEQLEEFNTIEFDIEKLLLQTEVMSLRAKIATLEIELEMEKSKLKEANKRHEGEIEDLVETASSEFYEFRLVQERLLDQIIREILLNLGEKVTSWKKEYEIESSSDPKTPEKNKLVAFSLLESFHGLENGTIKAVVVVGIVILAVIFPRFLISWNFIEWAWPRLLIFARGIDNVGILNWVMKFADSTDYKNFVKAWENGEPLTPKVIDMFNSETVAFVITNFAAFLLKSKRK